MLSRVRFPPQLQTNAARCSRIGQSDGRIETKSNPMDVGDGGLWLWRVGGLEPSRPCLRRQPTSRPISLPTQDHPDIIPQQKPQAHQDHETHQENSAAFLQTSHHTKAPSIAVFSHTLAQKAPPAPSSRLEGQRSTDGRYRSSACDTSRVGYVKARWKRDGCCGRCGLCAVGCGTV